MKKIAAFFTALCLFSVSVAIIHFATDGSLEMNNREFGTWTNSYKDASYEALSQNMNEATMLVMGSSELHHGVRSKFHPKAVFRDKDIDIMCVGAAYSQSLCQAITLIALEPDVKERKVVLMVSPSWFTKSGVKPEAFSARFSESNYIAMMENSDISDDLKRRISARTLEYLSKAQNLAEDVKLINRIYLENSTNPIEKMLFGIKQTFNSEKEKMTVLTALKTSDVKRFKELAPMGVGIDNSEWTELSEKALNYSKRNTTNAFFMMDRMYQKNIAPILKVRKNANVGRSYGKSPEYEDFRMFLDVCREANIKPLIVIQPVNGYWYDYTGFPEEGRAAMHENVLKIAAEYDVKVADFFNEGYTPYFLEDAVHPGGEGWVKINEKIYEFYHED